MSKKWKTILICLIILPCMVFFRGCSCSCSEGRTPSSELEDNNDTYTVMFYTNSGESWGYPKQEVVKGKYALRPEDPTKDGFVFKNWYINPTAANNCTDTTTDEYIFDFFQPVYQDVTLYAGWIERVYT